MKLSKQNWPAFQHFCKAIGVEDLKERNTSAYQPDYRFTHSGKLFWVYQNPNGYEIFGEDMSYLEKNWSEFTKQLKEKQKEAENDRNTEEE